MRQKPGFEASEPTSLRAAPNQQEAATADDGRFLWAANYSAGPAADAKASGDAAVGSPDVSPLRRGQTATQQVADDLDGLTAGMRAEKKERVNKIMQQSIADALKKNKTKEG
jgi:hypothetical protein